MSEKKNPYIPILILGWTGLVLVTALVLIASWWGYFVSTDDGVVDYLTVVIFITLLWSLIALAVSGVWAANIRDDMTDEIANFLRYDSALVIEKLVGERFRASRVDSLFDEVAYADTPEEAILKFVRGDTRRVENED